ncbi:hypothetical protein VUR80DRAFT_7025 [Thermomyces stellatus]
MTEGNQALSHDDIWDDSLLVDSWNQALEEYKKYHSIHAKGISLDEIASENRAESEVEAQAAQSVEGPSQAEQESESGNVYSDQADLEQDEPPDREVPGPAAMPTPQGLLGSVQDDGLKRLLMSWYYAGYYTGLYEGQQKLKSSAS